MFLSAVNISTWRCLPTHSTRGPQRCTAPLHAPLSEAVAVASCLPLTNRPPSGLQVLGRSDTVTQLDNRTFFVGQRINGSYAVRILPTGDAGGCGQLFICCVRAMLHSGFAPNPQQWASSREVKLRLLLTSHPALPILRSALGTAGNVRWSWDNTTVTCVRPQQPGTAAAPALHQTSPTGRQGGTLCVGVWGAKHSCALWLP